GRDVIDAPIAVVADQVLAICVPDGGEDQQGEHVAAVQAGEGAQRLQDLEDAGAKDGAAVVGCSARAHRLLLVSIRHTYEEVGGVRSSSFGASSPNLKPTARMDATRATTRL